MISKMERRKVFSYFRATSNRSAASIIAAFFLLSTVLQAQKAEQAPFLNVFRPNAGFVNNRSERSAAFSANGRGMELVTGNFDADGLLDTGAFDPASGLFTIRRSGDGSTLLLSVPKSKGRAVVVTADYDGDKRSDAAVWRGGTWQMLLSSRDYATDIAIFGIAGDVPVPADFDGDGKTDLAVFRASENRWYIRSSENGHVRTVDFGSAGTDLLLPADYTGDGKADPAVYRKGVWHFVDSETGVEETFSFGFDDARPAPADMDHDGVTDFVLYRKGTWYVYDGARLVSYKFGHDDDVPLSDVAVRQSIAGR